ncbi:MAG: discoidin domain-containing protein [Thermoguttaceae bacterium]
MTLLFSASTLFADLPRVVPVIVSADSENAGYEAFRAMDGDAKTMWHTQFSSPAVASNDFPFSIRCGYNYSCGYDHPKPATPAVESTNNLPAPQTSCLWGNVVQTNNSPCPHELRIDLGDAFDLTGLVLINRTDNRNGVFKEYEIYMSADSQKPGEMGEPVAKGIFETFEPSCRITFEKPFRARYVKLVELSEQQGNAFGSIAELELLCEGIVFRGQPNLPENAKMIPRIANTPDDPMNQERVNEWNLLAERFKTPQYWNAIESEVADKASLILPKDNDPVDVLLRRTGAMIRDLQNKESEKKLQELAEQSKQISVTETQKRFELFVSICNLRRQIMLNSPESPLNEKNAGFDTILFAKRHRSTYGHLVDQFYGRTQRPGGSGLFAISVKDAISSGPFSSESKLQNILENSVVQSGRLAGKKLEGGAFLSPDVSFDGTKLTFAYVEGTESPEFIDTLDVTRGHWNRGQCFHIFTCNVDGTNLRQITDGTWNDFDPCFLPNGRIAFISERRNGFLRCGRQCPTYTLFDMNEDGSQMRCLSYHETNEWNPSVTNDGKILYTRWDYVDRFGCVVHHPWTTTLDGRDPREVHGNYSHRHRRADAEFDCRSIPDSQKMIATGGPHHGQSFGSIVVIDPAIPDDDAMGPARRATPDVGFPESQGGGEVFGTPWPLNDKYFLCVADFSFQPGGMIPGVEHGRGNDGIYLCDIFGNRELIYRDATISSISPMPLSARKVPHFLPSLADTAAIEEQLFVGLRKGSRNDKQETESNISDSSELAKGTMSLVNVYDSLRPFPDGAKIKELRIIQLLPMTVPSSGTAHHPGIQEASSLDSFNLARCVLGTVPVEEDGSAHFEMPAQIEFQFQALDENGCAVQSMRSSSYLQPGEHLSCNGCHESKTSAPSRPKVQPKAFSRAASQIKPETVPGAYPFSYPILVQPILDKNCVECHEKPESKTFSLKKEPISNRFYASYNNLAKKYGFTNYGDPLRTTPGKFGAIASPLYKLLKDGHHEVKLSNEEMHRIILWLDCLSNFYGVYEKDGGEAQLRGEIVFPTLE